MIKTALKHWVYEFCIERMFNGVSKNFGAPKFIMFKEGQLYDEMFVTHPQYVNSKWVTIHFILHGCKIEDVVEGTVLISHWGHTEDNGRYCSGFEPSFWRVNIEEVTGTS